MKTRTRRFVKLTIGAELKTQLVTAIKVRRGPANDNKDFAPVVRRATGSSASRSASVTRATIRRRTMSFCERSSMPYR